MDELLRLVLDVGEPIVVRVRHELAPASQRLLAAFRAEVVVDPQAPACVRHCGRKECRVSVAVNDQVRVERAGDGGLVVMAARCGKCRTEVMPIRGGECPWCGSVIVDEDSLPVKQMLAELEARTNGRSEPGPVEPAPSPEGERVRPAAGDGASTTRQSKWSREKIIAAIQRWVEEHGEPPTQRDWLTTGLYWPSFSTAAKWCGGWSDAIRAAGFEPRRRGPQQSSGREPQAGSATADGSASTRDEAAASESSRPDDLEELEAREEPPKPATPPPVVEPDTLALANVADLTVNASAWIEALRGEADRLDRRSEALRMIATGLTELEETAP